MTAKSDQRIREQYGDVVVASPSENEGNLLASAIRRAHIGTCKADGCDCVTYEEHERMLAAQDAPPAPCVCHVDDGLVQEWVSKAREVAFSKGYQIQGKWKAPACSPAHEALIARLADYAEHTQRCEKWERDWHGNGIALLDERSCTCGLSDILTDLKEKQ